MTSLALIAQEYRSAAMALADLDLDPQTIADTLEGLSGDLEVKAQAVAHMVRSFEADAAACEAWGRDAITRSKAIGARADRLREYLRMNLEAADIQKIEGPGICIGWRKSSAVVVHQEELLPAEYLRQALPPPPEPDKKAIGAALKDGKDVPGAHLEHRRSLQIR